MTDLTPDLQFLVGEPLNAVHFVMDYVEMQFNGSYLRCLAPPTVEKEGRVATFPGPGSRDVLCGLIGASLGTFAQTTVGSSSQNSATAPLSRYRSHMRPRPA